MCDKKGISFTKILKIVLGKAYRNVYKLRMENRSYKISLISIKNITICKKFQILLPAYFEFTKLIFTLIAKLQIKKKENEETLT